MNGIFFTLFLLVGCASKVERFQTALDKGRHRAVERKVAKILKKKSDKLTPEQQEALHDIWGSSVLADLRLNKSSVRAHWFLKEFPNHFDRAEVLEIAASMALINILEPSPNSPPANGSREAALNAVAHAYWPSPSAKTAATIATSEYLARVRENGGNPLDYEKFQRRYPNFDVTLEASDAAVSWAHAQGTPTAWQQVLDTYPRHPKRTEMLAEYRKLTWGRIQSGGESQDTIWNFARRFYGTEEAYEAVGRGLELAGTIQIDQTNDINSVTLQFDALPPAGYALSLEVFVDGTTWEGAVEQRSAILAPLSSAPQAKMDVVMEGAQVIWNTNIPLCRLNATEQFEMIVTFRDGVRELASRHFELPVERTCQKARRMVFSNQENDIDGPLLLLQQADSGTWDVTKVLWKLPNGSECTHITSISKWGVFVECGKIEILAGWDANEIWIRETDKTQRRTERAPVTVLDKTLDPVGVRGKSPRKRLVNKHGQTLASLGERVALVAEAPVSVVFGGTCDTCETKGAPSIPQSLDIPSGPGAPMPEGATVSESCPSVISLPSEEWGVALDYSLAVVKPKPGSPVVRPEELKGWIQVLMIPSRPSQWECFDYEGHSYSRVVVMHENRPKILTLRATKNRWVVDTTRVP